MNPRTGTFQELDSEGKARRPGIFLIDMETLSLLQSQGGQLEFIGEDEKNISEPLRDVRPEIPWRRPSGSKTG
jgi:hypothetical protein